MKTINCIIYDVCVHVISTFACDHLWEAEVDLNTKAGGTGN